MELQLNIYKKKEIIKTYTADTYELMFGTVEDFLDLVEIDSIKSGDDRELIALACKAISKGMPMIKELLKEIFDGITDDELKNTKIKEIAKILVDIIKYSITEISKGADEKN